MAVTCRDVSRLSRDYFQGNDDVITAVENNDGPFTFAIYRKITNSGHLSNDYCFSLLHYNNSGTQVEKNIIRTLRTLIRTGFFGFLRFYWI